MTLLEHSKRGWFYKDTSDDKEATDYVYDL